MKRLLVAITTALAVAVTPSIAPSIARADTGISIYTFAVGGGFSFCDPLISTFCETTFLHFAFSAHQDLTDLTPTGHVVMYFTNGHGDKVGQLQGAVTCLQDAPDGMGGLGSITFQVAKSTLPVPTSPYVSFQVLDAGQQSALSDEISVPFNAATPDDCKAFGVPPNETVTKGNIVVSLQAPVMGAALQGDWWSTDTSGNLYVLDDSGNWELVQ